MEVKELMIGDLVLLDGVPKHLSLWDIVEISRGIYDAEPIPLTEDILKANGWTQSKWETCKSIYEREVEEVKTTMVKRSNGRWVVLINNIQKKIYCGYESAYVRLNIFFVNELQHAFHICKLDDLADNFRIGHERKEERYEI